MTAHTIHMIDVPASSIVRRLTLQFRLVGVKAWRRRLRAAAWLIKAAGLVAGVQVDVVLGDAAAAAVDAAIEASPAGAVAA